MTYTNEVQVPTLQPFLQSMAQSLTVTSVPTQLAARTLR